MVRGWIGSEWSLVVTLLMSDAERLWRNVDVTIVLGSYDSDNLYHPERYEYVSR